MFYVFLSDFNKKNSCKNLVREIIKKKLYPQLLINNARSLDNLNSKNNFQISREQFVGEFQVDVIAPYELSIALVHEKKISLKRIVNIGSIYGLVAANPSLYKNTNANSYLHYGVAKAALGHLTKELAILLAKKNILVNCIAFGGFKGRANKRFIENYKSLCPLNRMLTENDLLGPIDFFLSDQSSGITGQTLAVDGGWTIW